MMFGVLPAALTVYFVVIAVAAGSGAEWALNNQTYLYMNGWFHYAKLYASLAGCIGFMMIKYEWGIGKKHWFKAFPFAIVAINKIATIFFLICYILLLPCPLIPYCYRTILGCTNKSLVFTHTF